MPEAEAIRKQVERLTADLIGAGLAVDQNFPSLTTVSGGGVDLTYANMGDLARTLKNVSYQDLYWELREARSFNMRLIDGALVQLLYRFANDKVVCHRLAFFPSPDLLEYQNNSDIYETDELYADVIAKNVVTSPVRFDYDPEASVDYDHPTSHMTIGQYKNCRIPVRGPVNPFIFLNFLLRSFYNTFYRKYSHSLTHYQHKMGNTITTREEAHMHINFLE